MSFPTSDNSVSRRNFIRSGAGLAGAASIAGPLQAMFARRATGGVGRSESPYGPVFPVPDMTTGLPLIKLPKGFSYATFGWTGDELDDGSPTPGQHDGMGIVATGKNRGKEITLVRNHETGVGPIIGAGSQAVYDEADLSQFGFGTLGGGTTTLSFRTGRWMSSAPSLGGTLVNCAGGPTPWGSWLSCEEIVVDLTRLGAKRHGFVFEVPAPDQGTATGEPIEAMGLFRHEAVAVDPATGFVYETEDNGNTSGFYRFRPANTSAEINALSDGGELEMLKVKATDDLTSPAQGQTFSVEWVAIPDPTQLPAGTEDFIFFDGPSGPYVQGRNGGAAQFRRLEGCWFGDGLIYFVDTSGGPAREGVVWCYDPEREELTALFVSPGAPEGDNPDNITVSPRGGLLVCEDGGNPPGTNDGLRLLGLTAEGTTYEFAVNNVLIESPISDKPEIAPGDYRDNEWAGAVFDPFGKWLFVNIQTPGITFAITGPWRRGNL